MKRMQFILSFALTIMLGVTSVHPATAAFFRAVGDGEPPAFDTGVLGTDGQPKICQDGLHFGLAAPTERFTQDGEDRPWSLEIDFTDTDGYGQEFSRTLDVRALADPIEVEGESFGYMHYSTFDWSDTPAAMDDVVELFITNWDEAIEVADCRMLRTQFVQTAENTDSTEISDHLVFELDAHDPNADYGDGIAEVEMRIYDPDGRVVHERSDTTPSFCAFGANYGSCQIWDFAQNDFQWPDGSPIRNGPHVLHAYVHAEDREGDEIQEHIIGVERTVTITLPLDSDPYSVYLPGVMTGEQ